jgi:hypothetical protein
MKSRVDSVKYNRAFSSKNGEMHSWWVVMVNGDAGETATKSDKAPWAVGDEAEYTFEDGQYPKIKKVFAEGGGGGGFGAKKAWTPDPEKETRKERWAKQVMITRHACLNTAVEIIVGGQSKCTAQEVMILAEHLETWVKRGIDLKSLVATAEAPKPAPGPSSVPGHTPASTSEQAEVSPW